MRKSNYLNLRSVKRADINCNRRFYIYSFHGRNEYWTFRFNKNFSLGNRDKILYKILQHFYGMKKNNSKSFDSKENFYYRKLYCSRTLLFTRRINKNKEMIIILLYSAISLTLNSNECFCLMVTLNNCLVVFFLLDSSL